MKFVSKQVQIKCAARRPARGRPSGGVLRGFKRNAQRRSQIKLKSNVLRRSTHKLKPKLPQIKLKSSLIFEGAVICKSNVSCPPPLVWTRFGDKGGGMTRIGPVPKIPQNAPNKIDAVYLGAEISVQSETLCTSETVF